MITMERKIDEKVKILQPGTEEEYKKKNKKSAFNMIQDYDDSEEEIMNFSKNKRNELKAIEEVESKIINETNPIQENNELGGEQEYYEEDEDDLEEEDDEEDGENNDIYNIIKDKLGKEAYDKFSELKIKINEARNLNNKAVNDENKKSQDPDYEKNKKKEEYKIKSEEMKKILELQGVPENKLYVLDSVSKCEKYNAKYMKKKRTSTFGWDGII